LTQILILRKKKKNKKATSLFSSQAFACTQYQIVEFPDHYMSINIFK
jgi:hypothetical protein